MLLAVAFVALSCLAGFWAGYGFTAWRELRRDRLD